MEYIMGLCVVILSPVMQRFTKRMIKKTPFVKCKFRDSVFSVCSQLFSSSHVAGLT